MNSDISRNFLNTEKASTQAYLYWNLCAVMILMLPLLVTILIACTSMTLIVLVIIAIIILVIVYTVIMASCILLCKLIYLIEFPIRYFVKSIFKGIINDIELPLNYLLQKVLITWIIECKKQKLTFSKSLIIFLKTILILLVEIISMILIPMTLLEFVIYKGLRKGEINVRSNDMTEIRFESTRLIAPTWFDMITFWWRCVHFMRDMIMRST
jgi:hypothetical protein